MYGKVRDVPQSEKTPFYPRSPYGVSKVFGHYITVNYRESYGLFACSGILFNHESPRRGLEFVTRKVTDGVARIKLGLADEPGARQPRRPARLGFRRRLRPGDVADAAAGSSPTTTSSPPARRTPCSELVEIAFDHVGLDWERYVKLDPRFIRPAEVDLLIGDPAKARTQLGWTQEVDFARVGHDDGRCRRRPPRQGRGPCAAAGLTSCRPAPPPCMSHRNLLAYWPVGAS